MKRKIITIGVTIICVISLLTLSCFAGDYQIDNLTSYNIEFKPTVWEIEEASAFSYTFYVNFSSAGVNYRAIRIENDGLAFTIDYYYSQHHNVNYERVYDNGWNIATAKYIQFYNGRDIADPWLCEFVNNSISRGSIQHVTLQNPYSNLMIKITEYNYTSDFQSFLSYSQYQTGIQALSKLSFPAMNFYSNALIYPLILGGIIIAIVALLKRTKVSIRVDDDEKYHKTHIGFKK